MKSEDLSFRIFRYAVSIFLTLFALAPIYVMLTSSLKPLVEVRNAFEWWPKHVTFEAFGEMWQTVPLARYFANSLIVCTVSTLLALVVALAAAYGVSRYRFRGRGAFLGAVLSTQMFPGVLFLVPLVLIFVNIDELIGQDILYQTRTGLIVTFLTFKLPFATWMLVGYLDGIPKELDESAKVDGLNAFGALTRIVIPVARPGIIAVAVYCFMTSWGELLFSSVMTNADTATLAIGLRQYATQQQVYWNQIMAASLAVSVPIILIFLLVQRNLVSGLAAGSIK
ncbi:MAG: carbohydrate ABC transporter permease [Bifidobacteriaceae bacterium]|jgi:multiple sugar transport system permease protein|nr:carbohydrate ABC transporter permease [Bifidobacteriaceae bacterium]